MMVFCWLKRSSDFISVELLAIRCTVKLKREITLFKPNINYYSPILDSRLFLSILVVPHTPQYDRVAATYRY
jgi:hypothetical protein